MFGVKQGRLTGDRPPRPSYNTVSVRHRDGATVKGNADLSEEQAKSWVNYHNGELTSAGQGYYRDTYVVERIDSLGRLNPGFDLQDGEYLDEWNCVCYE